MCFISTIKHYQHRQSLYLLLLIDRQNQYFIHGKFYRLLWHKMQFMFVIFGCVCVQYFGVHGPCGRFGQTKLSRQVVFAVKRRIDWAIYCSANLYGQLWNTTYPINILRYRYSFQNSYTKVYVCMHLKRNKATYTSKMLYNAAR